MLISLEAGPTPHPLAPLERLRAVAVALAVDLMIVNWTMVWLRLLCVFSCGEQETRRADQGAVLKMKTLWLRVLRAIVDIGSAEISNPNQNRPGGVSEKDHESAENLLFTNVELFTCMT